MNDMINIHTLPEEHWVHPSSIILNIDDMKHIFPNHTAVIVCNLDIENTFVITQSHNVSPKMEAQASSTDEIFEAMLQKIAEISHNSAEHHMGLEGSMVEDRPAMMVGMAANQIARNTRTGRGNILLASNELYKKLRVGPATKIIEGDVPNGEYLLVANNIKVHKIERFRETFPNCEGIIMYINKYLYGPLSIRYRETEQGLEYDIKTIDELSEQLELDDDQTVFSKAANYIIKLVE